MISLNLQAISSPIEHIVIVLQENHTFDNYFGTYHSAEGTLGKNICIPEVKGSKKCVTPFHSSNLAPADMNHNWKTAHEDYDGGLMDGFVYSEGNIGTMGYFDRMDIPHYWNAADNYVLCDHYFTSVMSESAPNHLYLVAGTAGGLQDDNIPQSLSFPPIFEQLDQKSISWKVYGFTKWYESFRYVQSSSKKNFAKSSSFISDLSNGKLSQVSWFIGAPGGSEHPPQNIQTGEDSVANDIVNSLGSTSLWDSSVIFLTWDDYGGFYDHLVPPQVDKFGYGFRVPCLIVSPYAKPGYIDSTTYDHTSILKFIENRFGLVPLSTRDAMANVMGEAFDFTNPPRTFVKI